jgi:hypothetical protein
MDFLRKGFEGVGGEEVEEEEILYYDCLTPTTFPDQSNRKKAT